MSANNEFPWTTNGLTFRTRVDLENTVERFAGAGTKEHLSAAHELLREAHIQNKLNSDQIAGIKERLHL